MDDEVGMLGQQDDEALANGACGNPSKI